jgi:hypothetical protein
MRAIEEFRTPNEKNPLFFNIGYIGRMRSIGPLRLQGTLAAVK